MGVPKKIFKISPLPDLTDRADRESKPFTPTEIELARDIQTYLLPKSFPFPEKLEFGTIYKPARPIGGDFYDVIEIDNRRAAFIIGDTSGYSIPAALFMAQCSMLLKTLVKMDLSLLKVAETANEFFFEIAKPNMFVTLFIGIFDSFYNQLTYINAGHPPPLLIHSSMQIAVREMNSVTSLAAEGMALNCSRKIILEEKKQQLLNGDLLFLYTDGIIEAPNKQMEPIGEPAIRRLLHESKDLGAPEIAKKILNLLEAHSTHSTKETADLEDDQTALVIKLVD